MPEPIENSAIAQMIASGITLIKPVPLSTKRAAVTTKPMPRIYKRIVTAGLEEFLTLASPNYSSIRHIFLHKKLFLERVGMKNDH
jgi:hypothetical protein